MFFPVTVPYKTTPVMSRNTGPIFEPVTDQNHVESKTKELDRWGKDLFGCRRPDLVRLAASVLKVKNTENIVELAMNFKEDVAIMHQGVLESICFCYPSSWIPNERVGLTLAEIHKPVADGDMLRRVSQRIAETMATQDSFRRYVWTISTTNELSNHPKMFKPPVTDQTTVQDLWFRMETQTTMPLGDKESSLFFVKVDTVPLSMFWNELDKQLAIVDSINSMTDDILEYKNLKLIKEILNKNIAV